MRFLRFISFLRVLVLSSLFLAVSPFAMAQDPCLDCAERYLELSQKRGIQSEIDYLLPGDTLDLDRTKKRETERTSTNGDGSGLDDTSDTFWLIASILLLTLIAIVVFQNSAGGLVAFGRAPEEAAKPSKRSVTAKNAAQDDGLPKSEAAFLAEIEGMADRREALHLLAARLLSNAAAKTGIKPGRSWTARESLRALPRNWMHLSDLRHLNRQAELAWFGGRHVDDTVFADCLDRARAMMRGGAAR